MMEAHVARSSQNVFKEVRIVSSFLRCIRGLCTPSFSLSVPLRTDFVLDSTVSERGHHRFVNMVNA